MTDWGYLLYETEKHTPYGPEWFMHKPNINHTIPQKQKYRVGLNGCYIEMYFTDARWEEDDAQEALANQALICAAPKFREEVIRLRAWKKLVSDIVQQQDGSHLREMLKELLE
tara:strand:- start:275 stop:613 length:339 start_codon:yes stop_codon:yes gene_type:complete